MARFDFILFRQIALFGVSRESIAKKNSTKTIYMIH